MPLPNAAAFCCACAYSSSSAVMGFAAAHCAFALLQSTLANAQPVRFAGGSSSAVFEQGMKIVD